MKNYKSISAWLLAVLAVSLIGACGGGSSPVASRPEAVKPAKPAETKKDAEPVKTPPVQPEVKVEDVKVEQPVEPTGSKADTNAHVEQQTEDASQEAATPVQDPVVSPMGFPPNVETKSPFAPQEPVVIVNNSKPVVIDREIKVEPVVEDTKAEPATEVPEVKATEAKFKLEDRSVGYTFVTTTKSKLGLDDLDLQDDELYVRCEAAGLKPVHMIATVEYMKELQARDNLRPTSTGFSWTQHTHNFDCVVYGK